MPLDGDLERVDETIDRVERGYAAFAPASGITLLTGSRPSIYAAQASSSFRRSAEN